MQKSEVTHISSTAASFKISTLSYLFYVPKFLSESVLRFGSETSLRKSCKTPKKTVCSSCCTRLQCLYLCFKTIVYVHVYGVLCRKTCLKKTLRKTLLKFRTFVIALPSTGPRPGTSSPRGALLTSTTLKIFLLSRR